MAFGGRETTVRTIYEAPSSSILILFSILLLFSLQCVTSSFAGGVQSPHGPHVKKWYPSSFFGRAITSKFPVRLQVDITGTETGFLDLKDSKERLKVSGQVRILYQNDQYLVASKPPAVVCHHSEWSGSRNSEPEVPMIQRVRQAIGGRHVNLVHRLDRGASGCLLMTYSDEESINDLLDNSDEEAPLPEPNCVVTKSSNSSTTAKLINAMANPSTNKTYIALVRGEGIFHNHDMKLDGWFKVDRPIKNEKGKLRNATTWFRFVAGQDSFFRNMDGTISNETDPGKPRASLVLARPETGRWHQIRRHLNGLSHPILGDSSHGSTQTNREWRTQRGMLNERIFLHLAQIQIAPTTDVLPNGMEVNCDLPPDMMNILEQYLPEVLKQAKPILREEGIQLQGNDMKVGSCVRDLPFSILV
jgi:tRNA pseudouridine65 synthase